MDEFDLSEFLHREIKLEEPVNRRRNFFKKLVRLYQQHGLPVLRIVAASWDECCLHCKRSTPDRMFCRLVKVRLIEASLWIEEQKFDGCTLADILASGVFRQKARLPLYEEEGGKKPARPGHSPNCDRPACKGCC